MAYDTYTIYLADTTAEVCVVNRGPTRVDPLIPLNHKIEMATTEALSLVVE